MSLRFLLAPVTISILLLGCSSIPSQEPGVEHSVPNNAMPDGPLSAQSGGGASVIMEPPSVSRRTGTFGAFLLCTQDDDAAPVIDSIRFDVQPEPISVEAWFRHVPASAERQEPTDSGWNPYASVMGSPPEFTPQDKPLGIFTRDLPNPITAKCSESSPQSGFIELMTALTVDRSGAMVRHTYVDYHVGDTEYTLTINWKNGICGPALNKRDRCRP